MSEREGEREQELPTYLSMYLPVLMNDGHDLDGFELSSERPLLIEY